MNIKYKLKQCITVFILTFFSTISHSGLEDFYSYIAGLQELDLKKIELITTLKMQEIDKGIWEEGVKNVLEGESVSNSSWGWNIKGVPLPDMSEFMPFTEFNVLDIKQVFFYSCYDQPWVGDQWEIIGSLTNGVVFLIDGGVAGSTYVNTSGTITLAPDWISLINHISDPDSFLECFDASEDLKKVLFDKSCTDDNWHSFIKLAFSLIALGKKEEVESFLQKIKFEKMKLPHNCLPLCIDHGLVKPGPQEKATSGNDPVAAPYNRDVFPDTKQAKDVFLIQPLKPFTANKL